LDLMYPGHVIDTSHLGPGLYLIHICGETDLILTYKLIKQ
jgi:hypothetical protein